MARVKALEHIKHDNVDYDKDDVFEVTDKQAKALLEAGAVKVGKDYVDPDTVEADEESGEELDAPAGPRDVPVNTRKGGTKSASELAEG